MYHFWDIGGLVDDNYVAGCSEWGPIYFYTSDGFYVDMLMNDPACLPSVGPYTFWSETFSGYVRAFDKLKKVYAYTGGGIYAVDGFDENLRVAGEQRLYGSVMLDKVYGTLVERRCRRPVSRLCRSPAMMPRGRTRGRPFRRRR